MGGVPVKHHTKSKVGRRRSHLALKPARIFVCKNCGHPILPHRLCGGCGMYKNVKIKKSKIKMIK